MEQLTNVQEKIGKYYEREKDILHNKKIQTDIDELTDKQNLLKNKIKILNNEVRNIYGSLQVLENKRTNILDTIKKVEDLENENIAYRYYLDAIKRDGVPYE